MRRSALVPAFALCFAALGAAPAAALTLQPGHVLAASGPLTIVQIDPETGAMSGSLTLGSAPVGGYQGILDLVVLPDGDLMLSTWNASLIAYAFRVDPGTGAIGPVLYLNSLFGGQMLALEPGGTLITPGLHISLGSAILRVDATPSSVTPVASVDDVSSIPLATTVGPDGSIYASGPDDVFGFDPLTGARHVVTTGGLLDGEGVLAVGPDGTLYYASSGGRIVAVDPGSGAQSVVAETGISFGGELELGLDGQLLLLSDGTLHAIDPASGNVQTLATGLATWPGALAVVPAPEPGAALLSLAGAALALAARRRRAAPASAAYGARSPSRDIARRP